VVIGLYLDVEFLHRVERIYCNGYSEIFLKRNLAYHSKTNHIVL
jgi:hypothetical protein